MRRRRDETGASLPLRRAWWQVVNHKTAPRRDRRCLVCGGAGSTAGRRRHPPLRRAWWQVINHKTAPRRERRCLVCGGGVRQRDGGATGASTRSGWCQVINIKETKVQLAVGQAEGGGS